MMRFDEAIPAAIQLIRQASCNSELRITVVRDVTGQLSCVLEDDLPSGDALDPLAAALDESLGRFSPGLRRVLLRRSDLIDDQDILQSPDRVPLPDHSGVWVVDRLLTNLDWLRQPIRTQAAIPLATLFSLKGGVGRSTTVAVWAWHLARIGRRVVVVDLDLEAPGLTTLLLDDLPDYGLIDWLVEALLERSGQPVLEDYLAVSPLAADLDGIIQVLPALGAKTRDYVAKVGRVYTPTFSPAEGEVGIAKRLDELIQGLAGLRERPDAIILDSRAGLHDIGAAAVTQLGAEVFLFARDEPQSWQAYRLLFEHLARSKGIRFGMPEEDLRWRLKMVASQVDITDRAVRSWLDSSYEVWSALYDDDSKTTPEAPAATFALEDQDAPHHPLAVYFSGELRGCSFAQAERRPLWPVINAAFGDFLAGATERLLDPEKQAQMTITEP